MSLQLQYTIVAIILIAACLWMLRGILRMRRGKGGCNCEGSKKEKKSSPSCARCGLADACDKNRKH